jgi:hypothetical protein
VQGGGEWSVATKHLLLSCAHGFCMMHGSQESATCITTAAATAARFYDKCIILQVVQCTPLQLPQWRQ